MNWLSSMNTGSIGMSSMLTSMGGYQASYGNTLGDSAYSLLGTPFNASSLLSSGFVGSSLGSYGSQYSGGACSSILQSLFGQSSMQGYGQSSMQGYGQSSMQGYGPPPPPPPPHRRGDSAFGLDGYAGCNTGSDSSASRWPQSQGGTLSQESDGGAIDYTTTGGYKVNVNGSTVTVTDPSGKNTVQEWGDPHESVNGAQTGDWTGKNRSIMLSDGTKITMNAESASSTIQSTSIYDGSQAVQIDNTSNAITGVSSNPYANAQTERQQVDGDTAYFGLDRSGAAVFNNLYNQGSDYSITRNFSQIASLNQLFS